MSKYTQDEINACYTDKSGVLWRLTLEEAQELTQERDDLRARLAEIHGQLSVRGDESVEEAAYRLLCERTDALAKLAAAEKRIENQADRIRRLEGATNHATGTPLTKALERIAELEGSISGAREAFLEGSSANLALILGIRLRIEDSVSARGEK